MLIGMVNRAAASSMAFEDELLRCCARVSPSDEILARIGELVRRPLDWEAVLNRSWWHRIRPLTYRQLRAQPDGLVPAPVLLELAQHTSELAIRSRRLSKALADVARMFDDAGLRALIFKGPSLAEDAYGDVALRECGDLDLLVYPDDFTDVEQMLRTQGFTSLWDREKANRQVFACEFERHDAALDVHWHLAPEWLNYHVDFDALWGGGRALLPGGTHFHKLCPEDLLSVLCIHGTKHWWERLRWICDVAELANSGLITDWDRVELTAKTANCLRSVHLGLWLAKSLLSADLPGDVTGPLDQDSRVCRLGNQVQMWLGDAEKCDETRKLRQRFRFRMGVCERMRDRIPQIVHYLFARPSGQDE